MANSERESNASVLTNYAHVTENYVHYLRLNVSFVNQYSNVQTDLKLINLIKTAPRK